MGIDALASVGQLDFHFQHFKVVLALQVDLDVGWIDIDVLGQHRNQIALQVWQVVGLVGAFTRALMRQDDLQTLFGDAGGFFLFANQERQERHGLISGQTRVAASRV